MREAIAHLEHMHSEKSKHEHGSYKPKHHVKNAMAGHDMDGSGQVNKASKRVDQEVRSPGGAKSGPEKHHGEPRGRKQDESGISMGEQSSTARKLARMP